MQITNPEAYSVALRRDRRKSMRHGAIILPSGGTVTMKAPKLGKKPVYGVAPRKARLITTIVNGRDLTVEMKGVLL